MNFCESQWLGRVYSLTACLEVIWGCRKVSVPLNCFSELFCVVLGRGFPGCGCRDGSDREKG